MKSALAFILAGLALTSPAAADSVLEKARWSDRLLVVCGQDPATLAWHQQKLVEAEGYAERDLSVVIASPRSVTWEKAAMCSVESDGSLMALEGCSGTAPQVLLIGKDGGVKGRWATAVGTDTLFPLIDAMPMRLREMASRTGE
ncbi:MAG: DUF4174 domain-containing protein [Pseudomonadota bacterium]